MGGIRGLRQKRIPSGAPFTSETAPRRGRPKGSKNKIPLEFKEFCKEIVNGTDYQEKLKARVLEGKAGPMEQVVAYYGAGGKPKEQHEVSAAPGLSKLLLLAAQRGTGGDDGTGEGEV